MRDAPKILLAVAPSAHLAFRAIAEAGLDPGLIDGLRTATKPKQLRGWSHGTPVIAYGAIGDWEVVGGDDGRALGHVLLAMIARGNLRIAGEDDISAFRRAAA
jgi:hypothetical protein